MNYSSLSGKIRKNILDLAINSKEGHIASSFSIVEILLGVYFYLKKNNKEHEFLNRIVLSKGHAVFALYAFLYELGCMDKHSFDTVCKAGSYLIGHVPANQNLNFWLGTGSLGQGLPTALGYAYGKTQKGDKTPYFVIVGDGELNEGACWETLMLMNKFSKSNLCVLVDDNKSSSRAIQMHGPMNALRASWNTQDIDGHSIEDLIGVIDGMNHSENMIVICNTTKGYPLKQMINNPAWHHKTPNDNEVDLFKDEIDRFYGVSQ